MTNMKLMIVESPAKAKTIEKYLGSGWKVVASVGHIRDLVPESGSIDVKNDFAPKWQIQDGKEKVIKQITSEVKKSDEVYLASDPDREGEAIAWHLLEILKDNLKGKKLFRVAFHEITKKTILEELAHPRQIDQDLVDAYLVRRTLDYLIGFNLSPVLWKKGIGKSAGRVQSVAVFLVVDREKEIEAFKAEEYWSIDAECKKSSNKFTAKLTKFDGKKIEKMTIGGQEQAESIVSEISKSKTLKVSAVEKKEVSRRPYAPFTTSTLQQEAARKLHFSSKRTMSVAQKLYESGFITYMRTDSTNLSNDVVAEMRSFISKDFGQKYVPTAPNVYSKKSKNAQEAHEAVRPTHFDIMPDLDGDDKKLYDLIWKRALASQMTNALFDATAVDLDGNKSTFRATGQIVKFDGFLSVYNESKDEDSDDEDQARLPELIVGDVVDVEEYKKEQHFTMPPPRYTEASLVKKLEELGIGRPSTYATIMSTIVDRGYVELDKSRRFMPKDTGWVATAFLENYFADLIKVDFTAKTEDALDDVANGDAEKNKVLTGFWSPFEKWVADASGKKTEEVWDKINKDLHDHVFKETSSKCPECGGELGIRKGKFGVFISCKNYPNCKFIKNLSSAESKDGGEASELGDGIKFKVGRFGPYVTDGTKNASAKKYTAETITLEIAKDLLSNAGKKVEAISLGKNPVTNADILFYPTGRYGAYISSNKVNVSVKEQPSLDEAADLINNKKPSTYKKKWNR